MWPDRVSNPGPLTYESGALPTALRGQATVCQPAGGDNPRALVSGLSFVQADNYGFILLLSPYPCRPSSV